MVKSVVLWANTNRRNETLGDQETLASIFPSSFEICCNHETSNPNLVVPGLVMVTSHSNNVVHNVFEKYGPITFTAGAKLVCLPYRR